LVSVEIGKPREAGNGDGHRDRLEPASFRVILFVGLPSLYYPQPWAGSAAY